jgi:hypothetical protein
MIFQIQFIKLAPPTLYDAHHYLVPTPENINQQFEVDSYGYITKNVGQIEGRNLYDMILYAPLISSEPDSLYTTVSQLVQVTSDYFSNQEQAVMKYRGSMNQAAWAISNNNISSRTSADIGGDASQIISSFGTALLNSNDQNAIKQGAPGCDSINGSFVWFLIGAGPSGNAVNPASCDPNNRLINMLETRWNTLVGEQKSIYYIEKYLSLQMTQ